MSDEFITFNTYDPKYKILRQEINKLSTPKQSEYTDRLDAIAMKKIRKLVNES